MSVLTIYNEKKQIAPPAAVWGKIRQKIKQVFPSFQQRRDENIFSRFMKAMFSKYVGQNFTFPIVICILSITQQRIV